jgi:hypothetical protein
LFPEKTNISLNLFIQFRLLDRTNFCMFTENFVSSLKTYLFSVNVAVMIKKE